MKKNWVTFCLILIWGNYEKKKKKNNLLKAPVCRFCGDVGFQLIWVNTKNTTASLDFVGNRHDTWKSNLTHLLRERRKLHV